MDFKSFREDKLKLSQEQFSSIYDVNIEDVKSLDLGDKQPEWGLLEKIAKKNGMDLKTILRYEKPNLTAEQKEKYVKLLDEIEKNEPKRAYENDKQKEHIRQLIADYAKKSTDEVIPYIASNLKVDAITVKIKKANIKNKKEEVQVFAKNLQDEIAENTNSMLKKYSDQLSVEIDKYINHFNTNIKVSFAASDVDVKYPFYLTLAKFGKPLLLFPAIRISMLVPHEIAKLLGVEFGWEKSIAKKIAAEYKNLAEKYHEKIQESFLQTKDAFNKAANELDVRWDNYVKELRDTVNKYQRN